MNNGYGICLNEWLEDERIKTELRLLIKISSLTADNGICYASNEHFAEYFNTSTVTISKQIKKLESLGYIEIDYKRRGAEIIKRDIRLKKTLTDDYQKLKPTIKENFKENNTSINNKESKGANAPKQQKTFIPPTIGDINTYVQENSLNVDTQKFFKYYTASEWKDNKGRAVKNWKLKLISWDNQNAHKQTYKKFEDMTFEEKMEYNEQERQRKIEANYGDL